MFIFRSCFLLIVCFVLITPFVSYCVEANSDFGTRHFLWERETAPISHSSNIDLNLNPAPARDEFGDIIRRVPVDEGYWIGLAFDGENMWGLDIEGARMVCVTLGGMEIDNIDLPLEEMGFEEEAELNGMCWDGEAFWFCSASMPDLFRVSPQGQLLDRFEIPVFGDEGEFAFDVAWDGENLWYSLIVEEENGGSLVQVRPDGELLRQVDCNGIEGSDIMAITWVPEHEDGHLWVMASQQHLIYQMNLEGDQPMIVQEILIDIDSFSICHDGTNLWYQEDPDMGGIWVVLDDGIVEEGIEDGNILQVPDDFETIQDAIDEAEDFDIIQVDPGEYNENIDFSGKAITLCGNPENPNETIIDGGEDGTVVTFVNGETDRSVLTGFTIRNGVSEEMGGGIYVEESYPIISDCIVTGNSGDEGGGIICVGGAYPIISNCEIFENTTENNGAGILCDGESNPTIISCYIHNNEAAEVGGGISCDGSGPAILSCFISENNAGSGGGVSCVDGTEYLRWTTIVMNEAEFGNAIYASGSIMRVINCTISMNRGREGTIYFDNEAWVDVLNTIIWDNQPNTAHYNEEGEPNLISIAYTDVGNERGAFSVFNENGESDWGEGNFNADPLFGDPENGNFRLTEDSPCIDAGDPEFPPDEDGSIVDLGAIPFTFGPPVISIDPLIIEVGFGFEDPVLTVTNNGLSLLRWATELEYVDPPEDDRGARRVREIENSGPQRDELGDVIVELEMEEAAWGGLTRVGDLIWAVDYEGFRIVGVSPEGEIIEEVDLPAEEMDIEGFWSLCWDGEVFWAGCEEFVALFAFDREGNLLRQVNVPGDGPGVTSIEWDGEFLWYWVPEDQASIRQITRDGQLIREVDVSDIGLHEEGSDYWALAYVPEHGESNMWAMVGEEEFLCQVNIEEDRAEVRSMIDIEQGQAFGLTHDGENLWFSMEGDRWYIIDDGIAEASWLMYEPHEGTIEPGDADEIFIVIDAVDLEDGDHFAEMHFISNDPVNPEVVVDIILHLGAVGREFILPLAEGWNMSSINIIPSEDFWPDEEAPGPDLLDMFEQLRIDENNHLIELLKDRDGRFWAPEFGFNNIPFWNLTHGYQIKVSEDCEARWIGEQIPAEADIELLPAWDLIAYLPTYELDASAPDFYVLSPIIDFVLIAKDADGRFMTPEFNFSNMQPWRETQGYQVKINSEDPIILNYPPEQEELNSASPQTTAVGHWSAPVSTGSNMSILIMSIEGLSPNTYQVATFDSNGNIVGVGTVRDGMCGLSVWGDDKSTESVDGLSDGESFELQVWDENGQTAYPLDIVSCLKGDGLIYKTDDFVVLSASVNSTVPVDYYLAQNYPNPFNSVTKLSYGLPENTSVSMKIYDTMGRLTTTLLANEQQAGHHNVVWDARNVSSGVYVVQMKAGGLSLNRKVVLVK